MDTGLIRPYSVIQWRCQWSAFRGWPSHSMCSRPHFTGKPDWPRADFAENCLPRAGSKASAVSRFRERGPRNYRVFAKNRTLGRHVREISEMGGQKMGSNMRPRYIRFRDIHDRDISGLHCIALLGGFQGSHFKVPWCFEIYWVRQYFVNVVLFGIKYL